MTARGATSFTLGALLASAVVGRAGATTATGVCGPAGWCWDWPRPFGRELTDVWEHDGVVWAAGAGVLVRDCGVWRDMGLDWRDGVVAVRGKSGRDVWALSRSGRLAHWAGIRWEETDAVQIEAERRLVASGGNGRVTFDTLWISPAGEVWAAGGIRDDAPMGKNDESGDRSRIGFVAHRLKGAWVLEQDDRVGPLTTIGGTSDSDVWACTASCAHWDGQRLKRGSAAPAGLGLGTDGHLSKAAVWHMEGDRLVPGALPADAVDLHDVLFTPGLGVVAVGGRTGNALVLRRTGESWTEISIPSLEKPAQPLWRAVGDGSISIWLGGERGTNLRMSSAGLVSAGKVDLATRTARGLASGADGEVWLGVGTTVRHGSGTGEWKTLAGPPGRNVEVLAARGSTDVWAYAPVRDLRNPTRPTDGPVLFHWDGEKWASPFSKDEEKAALGPWREVWRMELSPRGTVWITARVAVARIPSGGRIEPVKELPLSSRDGDLYLGLWVPAEQEVWIVGEGGVRWFDGGTWRRESLPGTPRVEAIWGTAEDIFAVGARAILHRTRPSPAAKHR